MKRNPSCKFKARCHQKKNYQWIGGDAPPRRAHLCRALFVRREGQKGQIGLNLQKANQGAPPFRI